MMRFGKVDRLGENVDNTSLPKSEVQKARSTLDLDNQPNRWITKSKEDRAVWSTDLSV